MGIIKVLVVDDSGVLRKTLKHILNTHPSIAVTGCAKNGKEALEFLEKYPVDVVTMDIVMPGMDGFETTRCIMESSHPVPVIIISAAWNPQEVHKTFQAMQAGAVGLLRKPGEDALESPSYRRELFAAVEEAAQATVRKLSRKSAPFSPKTSGAKRIVRGGVIGASTGGPQALSAFLSGLSENFRPPVFVVQHIGKGFTQGLADWLNRVTPLNVKVAEPGEKPLNGWVYVAPAGVHMGLCASGVLEFSHAPREHMVRPSASWLFRSAAKVYRGDVAAVLLSGMGRDGAEEMKHLRDLGALTFAQNKESSVVWGMPGEAVKLGGAEHVASPLGIASMLEKLVKC